MGKLKGRRKEKKRGVPEVGTGAVTVPLGLRRNKFRCFLANPGASVIKSKPAVVQCVIEISIWPTRSRARIDLSNSLVERGVGRALLGESWSREHAICLSWSSSLVFGW